MKRSVITNVLFIKHKLKVETMIEEDVYRGFHFEKGISG
jgi:hypothetical protein